MAKKNINKYILANMFFTVNKTICSNPTIVEGNSTIIEQDTSNIVEGEFKIETFKDGDESEKITNEKGKEILDKILKSGLGNTLKSKKYHLEYDSNKIEKAKKNIGGSDYYKVCDIDGTISSKITSTDCCKKKVGDTINGYKIIGIIKQQIFYIPMKFYEKHEIYIYVVEPLPSTADTAGTSNVILKDAPKADKKNVLELIKTMEKKTLKRDVDTNKVDINNVDTNNVNTNKVDITRVIKDDNKLNIKLNGENYTVSFNFFEEENKIDSVKISFEKDKDKIDFFNNMVTLLEKGITAKNIQNYFPFGQLKRSITINGKFYTEIYNELTQRPMGKVDNINKKIDFIWKLTKKGVSTNPSFPGVPGGTVVTTTTPVVSTTTVTTTTQGVPGVPQAPPLLGPIITPTVPEGSTTTVTTTTQGVPGGTVVTTTTPVVSTTTVPEGSTPGVQQQEEKIIKRGCSPKKR